VSPRRLLTAERLREVLNYEAETGIFRWRKKTSHRIAIGDVAGTKTRPDGYCAIAIDGTLYLAHRLAWMYINGSHAENFIDHINGNPSDNRIANLREATQSVNMQNQKKATKKNKTGFLGVDWHKRANKFRAAIRLNGKQTHIGYFQTPEEAHQAYLRVKRSLHIGNTL
jgi:HNH endonuclease/AP2 domain